MGSFCLPLTESLIFLVQETGGLYLHSMVFTVEHLSILPMSVANPDRNTSDEEAPSNPSWNLAPVTCLLRRGLVGN